MVANDSKPSQQLAERRYSRVGYWVDAVSLGELGKIAGLHVRCMEPDQTESYLTRAEVFHAMTEGVKFYAKRREIFPVEIRTRPFLRLQRDSVWRQRSLRLGGNSHPEDHLVGLPERAAPSPRTEPSLPPSTRVVYLDHCVWSNFGKLLTLGRLRSAEMTAIWKTHLDELRSLVAAEQIVCPISFAHCVELSNYDNPEVRSMIASLMVELSQGRCIPRIALGSTHGQKPQLCNAVDMTPVENAHYLDDMRELSSRVALDAYLKLFLSPEAMDRMRPDFRKFIKDVMSQLRRRSKGSFSTTFDPNPTVDVRWADEVFTLRLKNPNQKAKPGDPMDLLHLLAASATDIALLERGHTAMVRHAKFGSFQTCNDIEDLIAAVR